MQFALTDLLEYDDIVIQCHDNPDADALASGFALKWYLGRNGKNARFIYSGRTVIGKSNLVLMMQELNIPVEYVTELDKPQLLVTVDCQYGESNVTRFDADNIAVIDHHQVSGELPEMSLVKSNYGSCSTVIYKLLQKENININEDSDLATALYYGLMTDTDGFAEISHPSDKDLRDLSRPRITDITRFKNSNLSREEMTIAGDALKSALYNEDKAFAIVSAKPCDPNILGVISDMLLEVDSIDTCLVYSILSYGIKLSVRSCVKEVRASELASYLASGFGGGGGHLVKAGGLMKKDLLLKAGIDYEEESLKSFLNNRMEKYFDESVILYAGEHHEDISEYEHFVKKEVSVGFVKATEFASAGSQVLVRTLEGDVDITVDDDVYIIIGIAGEVYPIDSDKFHSSYKITSEEYEFPGEYAPAIIDTKTGDRLEILSLAKSCVSRGKSGIYAKRLDHKVKVFTKWDPERYYLGNEGDYIAVRDDDTSDIYIIDEAIFPKTYEAG